MLNHITIMGRLTRDPELRRTGSGLAVAAFSVAVERDFGGQDGKKETDFIDCVAWRQGAEFVSKYFHKGDMIAVSGRLQIRSWTDKDGNKRRSAEVVAESCYFGGNKRSADTAAGGGGEYYSPVYEAIKGGVYAGPNGPSDFAMLEDDDAQLPF